MTTATIDSPPTLRRSSQRDNQEQKQADSSPTLAAQRIEINGQNLQPDDFVLVRPSMEESLGEQSTSTLFSRRSSGSSFATTSGTPIRETDTLPASRESCQDWDEESIDKMCRSAAERLGLANQNSTNTMPTFLTDSQRDSSYLKYILGDEDTHGYSWMGMKKLPEEPLELSQIQFDAGSTFSNFDESLTDSSGWLDHWEEYTEQDWKKPSLTRSCQERGSTTEADSSDCYQGAPQRMITLDPFLGIQVPLFGSEETQEAIRHGATVTTACSGCLCKLTCVNTADYVVCGECFEFTPTSSKAPCQGNGLVGLGIQQDLVEMLQLSNDAA